MNTLLKLSLLLGLAAIAQVEIPLLICLIGNQVGEFVFHFFFFAMFTAALSVVLFVAGLVVAGVNLRKNLTARAGRTAVASVARGHFDEY